MFSLVFPGFLYSAGKEILGKSRKGLCFERREKRSKQGRNSLQKSKGLRGFPCFLVRFPLLSRDFRGSVGTQKPCFFGGFACLLPKKKQGKEEQASKFGQRVQEVGPRLRDEPKGTNANMRFSAGSCSFSAVSCENLQFSAKICVSQIPKCFVFWEKARICKNQAKLCRI